VAKLFGVDLPAFGVAESQVAPAKSEIMAPAKDPFDAAIARAKSNDIVMRNPGVKKKPPRRPSWSLR
jgi:hypothetical protein